MKIIQIDKDKFDQELWGLSGAIKQHQLALDALDKATIEPKQETEVTKVTLENCRCMGSKVGPHTCKRQWLNRKEEPKSPKLPQPIIFWNMKEKATTEEKLQLLKEKYNQLIDYLESREK